MPSSAAEPETRRLLRTPTPVVIFQTSPAGHGWASRQVAHAELSPRQCQVFGLRADLVRAAAGAHVPDYPTGVDWEEEVLRAVYGEPQPQLLILGTFRGVDDGLAELVRKVRDKNPQARLLFASNIGGPVAELFDGLCAKAEMGSVAAEFIRDLRD